MLREKVYDKKRPLIAQAVSAAVFIGLCIFACFTAFYRTGTINISAITTIVMYIGELILMGGVLFKFGKGFLFEPLGAIPFAIIDLIVILLSGVITYLLLHFLNKQPRS